MGRNEGTGGRGLGVRVGGGVTAVQKDVERACGSIRRAELQQAAVATGIRLAC